MICPICQGSGRDPFPPCWVENSKILCEVRPCSLCDGRGVIDKETQEEEQ
jgi:hypothetical protein